MIFYIKLKLTDYKILIDNNEDDEEEEAEPKPVVPLNLAEAEYENK